MKIISPALIALLCSSNTRTSFSFLSSQPNGKGGRIDHGAAFDRYKFDSKTLMMYSRDDFYDNKFHRDYSIYFNGYSHSDPDYNYNNDYYNDYYNGNDSSYNDDYLHQVSNIRGGSNGGSYRSSNNSQSHEFGSLNFLSVSELKRLLNDRGVDYRDCLEKRDLIERVLSSPASAALDYSDRTDSSSSYASNTSRSGGGLSQEENRVVNTFTRSSPSVAYIQTISQQQTIRGFSLKGTEVPTGAGSGFLWDDKVSEYCNFVIQ